MAPMPIHSPAEGLQQVPVVMPGKDQIDAET